MYLSMQLCLCERVQLAEAVCNHFSVLFLCQELVKHTHDAADKSNLKIALDAMKASACFE